jgi:hypothetical protein
MDIYWNIFRMHGPMNVKFPNNTIKWQMEFNSAFKGLNVLEVKMRTVNLSTICSHPFPELSIRSQMPHHSTCCIYLNNLYTQHTGHVYSFVCVSLRNFPLHVLLLLLLLLFKNLFIFLANYLYVFIWVILVGQAVQPPLIKWDFIANLIFPFSLVMFL